MTQRGFLNINKPTGITSHDVVAQVRRLVGRKLRVGHAGTLDPAASGVLPVALGQATRLIEYLADSRKGYRAVVALGQTTTTDDAAGEPLEQRPVPALTHETIEAALAPLRGPIQQVPPMYSALHHQGQRLYDLARAGTTVERAPRPVTIYQLDLLALHTPPTAPTTQLTLDVTCSKGTYIRALARDLGAALGCGAHLAALERTWVGDFTLEQAVPLDALQRDTLTDHLLPADIAVRALPAATFDAAQSAAIRNGRPVRLTAQQQPIAADTTHTRLRAYAPDGTLLALLRPTPEPNTWQPDKVLA
jgi:tRNA pseudouridine55 synthase